MKTYLILNHLLRRAILTCQDGYGDDTKACKIAWEQFDEVRMAIIRKNEKKPQPPKKDPTQPNELSTRVYDI